ncbi:hypothetical protein OX283_006550 [Flavobacterium sp. SUN052]|uniref:hypothetical protein n=1 Tax=Flavobacterium sp. SUN052 TaxID=3002441 RepID=UPI00237DF4AE|nr:hypothetical protein [Flavobacterium sp. SUN052]MEC4004309.1 hypothetical protein [Flavobacterium sp. SUN052]
MKTTLNFHSFLALKAFNKTHVLFLVAIVTTSLLVSCTADEIEVQPKNTIKKELNLQRTDTIFNAPNTTNTTNTTTNSGEINPIKTPPPPSNP